MVGCAKVIDCVFFPGWTMPGWTGKDCGTSRAGAYLSLPPWEAVIVQVPTAAEVTVEPETVHTSGVFVLKLTGSLLDALALRVTSLPTVAPLGGVKEMVCAIFCDREGPGHKVGRRELVVAGLRGGDFAGVGLQGGDGGA